MSYRQVNNVGYKKIYPMSLNQDDSFCHYCGRIVSPSLGLHWDHVPALNVKIPIDYGILHDLKRTLVRSCSECNQLASDVPHLDYLERHFWLKVRYLRHYKSILVNQELKPTIEQTVHPNASNKPTLPELLSMLGFGIKDIESIKSPILDVRNKPTNKKIINLVIENLTISPHDLDDDQDELPMELVPNMKKSESLFIPSFNYVLDFIITEREVGKDIFSDASLVSWIETHPTRAKSIEFYVEDVPDYNIDWTRIKSAVTEEEQGNILTEDYSKLLDKALYFMGENISVGMTQNDTPLAFPAFIELCQKLNLNKSNYQKIKISLEDYDLAVHLHERPDEIYTEFNWDVCWLTG